MRTAMMFSKPQIVRLSHLFLLSAQLPLFQFHIHVNPFQVTQMYAFSESLVGLHAREWLSPTTALYLIRSLIQEIESRSKAGKKLSKVSWYIVPLVNPDGYEYSHTNERLWRKNRAPSPRGEDKCFV